MKIVDESILFFSRVSLSKFSLEVNLYISGYKGIYSRVYEESEKSCFNQIGHFDDSTSRMEQEFESRANCLARLEVSSCSAPAVMTLQLSCMLHTCATFGDLLITRSNRETLFECTYLEFSSHL